ncbi:MAG: methyltransferase domain-containing protein [Spirochaetia bacterium]|nr:methyltransferase domain-containing protein [Spirochaetia bacterium]
MQNNFQNASAIQTRYSQEAKEEESNLSCGSVLSWANLQANEIVVDLGCGKGNEVFKASKFSHYVYGIDFTQEMIDKAKKYQHTNNVQNVEFINGTIDSVPLYDSIADVVISNCAINHSSDKSIVYSEIYRILKPGGRFIVSDIVSQVQLPEYISNDPQAIAQCYGGAITQNDYFLAIQQAGFTNIDILHNSLPYEKKGVLIRSITLKSVKT